MNPRQTSAFGNRTLRPGGYVYVHNPKDPAQKTWRGYLVDRDYNLIEFDIAPDAPMSTADEKPVCYPDKNGLAARCLTLPGADKAGEVWIGYAEVKWTRAVLDKHHDPAWRNRHMRRLDIAAWRKTRQHAHAQCIHALKKNDYESVPSPIAELACPHTGKDAFAFSPADFTPMERRVPDPYRLRRLLEARGLCPKGLNDPLTEHDKEILNIFTAKLNKDARDIFRLSQMGEFDRLIQAFERYYDRPDKNGQKPDKKYEGQGMLLALDDAPAVAMDLAGLMAMRARLFNRQKAFRRPLAVRRGIGAIQGRVRQEAGEIAQRRAAHYRLQIEHPEGHANYQPEGRQMTEAENREYERRQGPEYEEEVFREEWGKYADRLGGADGQNKADAFFAQGGDYHGKLSAFAEAALDPLARAHVAWMQSGALIEHFVCNFDAGKAAAEGGEEDGPEEAAAAEHSGPYVELLARAIGDTGNHPLCAQYYKAQLTGERDERNLIWRALVLNRDMLAAKLDTAFDAVESLGAQARQLTGGAQDDAAQKQSAVELIAQWGWAWWDAICTGRQAGIQAFSVDAQAERRSLEAARAAYREADTAQTAAASTATQASAAQSAAGQAEAARQSASAAAAQSGIATRQAARQAQSAQERLPQTQQQHAQASIKLQRAMKQLPPIRHNSYASFLEAIQKPLAELAAQEARTGQRHPGFARFLFAMAAHNGTPGLAITLNGTPREIARALTRAISPTGSASGHQAFLSRFEALPDRPMSVAVRIAGEADILEQAARLNATQMDQASWRRFLELMAGRMTIEVKNLTGAPGLQAWRLAWGHLKALFAVETLQQEVGRLQAQWDKERETYRQANEEARAKEQAAARDKARALELGREAEDARSRATLAETGAKRAEADLKAAQARLDDKLAALPGSERENRSRAAVFGRAKTVQAQERLRAAAGGGYSVFNIMMAGCVLAAMSHRVEKLADAGVGGDAFKEASTMYTAACMTYLGAMAEAVQAGVKIGATRNWMWAKGLYATMEKSRFFRVSVGIGGSALSFVAAFWDGTKAWEAIQDKQTGWFIIYATSAVLGFASGIVVFASAIGASIGAPVIFTILAVYAAVSGLIAYFAPNDMQKWLNKCYFGKDSSAEWDTDWSQEAKSFSLLGLGSLEETAS